MVSFILVGALKYSGRFYSNTVNPLSEKFFFGLFWSFLAENGWEGLKDPFLVQKIGGTFFLGGVKKNELGVGNYP